MKNLMNWIGFTMFFGLWLCGLSFDQVRLFNMCDIPIAYDGRNYLQMSYGNYGGPAIHRCRILIPGAVGILRKGAPEDVVEKHRSNLDKSLFFLVNLILGGLMLAIAYRFLLENGISPLIAFTTTLIFGGSRFILQAVSQQMVDMGLYLAVAALVYFLSTDRWRSLSVWMPLMALSKEMMFPLLLIPALIVPREKRVILGISYLLTILTVLGVRHVMYSYPPDSGNYQTPPPWAYSFSINPDPPDPGWAAKPNETLVDMAKRHLVVGTMPNLQYLFSPRGAFDIFIAFGCLWPLMIWGLRHGISRKTAWLWFLLPYALGCGLLSRHWGRQLTIAFPLVILCAATGLEKIGRVVETAGMRPKEDGY